MIGEQYKNSDGNDIMLGKVSERKSHLHTITVEISLYIWTSPYRVRNGCEQLTRMPDIGPRQSLP